MSCNPNLPMPNCESDIYDPVVEFIKEQISFKSQSLDVVLNEVDAAKKKILEMKDYERERSKTAIGLEKEIEQLENQLSLLTSRR